jgi:hypothetical protein
MSGTKTDSKEALLKQLKNPIDPRFVKWRVGATNKDKTKGIALAYIDSREVMKRLDDVMGVDGWQDRYIPVDNGFICEIDLWIDGRWVTKSNAAGNTKVEPIKGGASDAFKRAAANWGVGRFLYYLPNIWVPIKQQGKSYVLAEIPEPPEWAKPQSNIERWEDVAELEASKDSGADVDDTDQDMDAWEQRIFSAKTSKELSQIMEEMSAEEKKKYVAQITRRNEELNG